MDAIQKRRDEGERLWERFRNERVVIGPSLLAADFARLGEELRAVESAGARVLHCDIMDGVFVPNISFGFPILDMLRRHTSLPLDVHLMVADPDRIDYIERFAAAGATMISFHLEAMGNVARCGWPGGDVWRDDRTATERAAALVRRIRELGVRAGIALSPQTPMSAVEPLVETLDFVLVMSVEPGFGNQAFLPESLDKVRGLRGMTRRPGGEPLVISIDGGVNRTTIGACVAAGVDYPIAGTAVFGAGVTDRNLPAAEQYRANLAALGAGAGDRSTVVVWPPC